MADDNKAKIVLSAEDKTKAAFDSAKKSLKDLQASAEGIGANFGTLGVAIAGAFEAASLKDVVELGDQLNKMSQKTGIAVDALSALGYAGKLANVGLEDLATGIKHLGNNMADAAGGGAQAQAAFAAIGVSVKNANGTLKSTNEVLGDVADKFASYEDGAGKAALATALFGKNGATLIPLLNQGSAGLEEARKEAEKFGIVIGPQFAEQAERFNDNLTKINESLKASKIRIAEELLPTLNTLSEAFLSTREAGQGSLIGDALRTGLETVAVLGANVAFVFKGVGREIGAIAAQAVALATGNFAGIGEIHAAVLEDGRQARAELDEFEKRVLRIKKEASSFTPGLGVNPANLFKKPAPVIDKGGAQESLAAFDAIIKKIQERGAAEAQLLAVGRDLTEGEKFGLQVATELGQAHSKLTDVQKAQAAAQLEQVLQLAKGNDERKRQLEADKATSEAAQQHIADIFKEIDARRDANKTLGDQIEEIGLTADGLDRLRIKRLESAKAQEEENLALARGKEASDAELTALQQNIDLLDRQINLRRADKQARDRESNDPTRGAQRALDDYVDTAKKAGDSAEALTKKTTQGLEDGLTAALTGGKFGIHQFVDEVLAEIVRLSVVKPFLASIFSTQGTSLAGGIGGVLSGIGSFFGGLFADGGSLGAGKWGIAGEAGPEWVKGPAQIVPMTGGGGYVDNRTINNYIDSNTNQAQIGSIVSVALQSYDRDLMSRLKAAGVGA